MGGEQEASNKTQWRESRTDILTLFAYVDGIIPVQIAHTLSQGSGRIHGIDSSEDMIAAAKKAAIAGGEEISGVCTFQGIYSHLYYYIHSAIDPSSSHSPTLNLHFPNTTQYSTHRLPKISPPSHPKPTRRSSPTLHSTGFSARNPSVNSSSRKSKDFSNLTESSSSKWEAWVM